MVSTDTVLVPSGKVFEQCSENRRVVVVSILSAQERHHLQVKKPQQTLTFIWFLNTACYTVKMMLRDRKRFENAYTCNVFIIENI